MSAIPEIYADGEWHDVYPVMRPFGDPEKEDDIGHSFGVKRSCNYMSGLYMQFACRSDPFCSYKLRWHRKTGQLQECGRHYNHPVGVRNRDKGKSDKDWYAANPLPIQMAEETKRRAAFGVYPATRASPQMNSFWKFSSRNAFGM